MGIEKGIFKRMELLVGEQVMQRTADARVIIFGVGGVGSWCAESLVRSGIRHLTIVDCLYYEHKPSADGHDKDRGQGEGGSAERTSA